jgi:hypothetical protein
MTTVAEVSEMARGCLMVVLVRACDVPMTRLAETRGRPAAPRPTWVANGARERL